MAERTVLVKKELLKLAQPLPKTASKIYFMNSSFDVNCIYSMFIMKCDDGDLFAGEKHELREMLYVIDGNITVTENENIYDMKKGDIIFHNPNEFHSFIVKKNNECTFMVISYATTSDMLNVLGDGIYKLNSELHNMLINCYDRIKDGFFEERAYITKKSDNYDPLSEAYAVKSFELFLISVLLDAKKPKRLDNSIGAQNYRSIINTLNEHIYEQLTIEDIAKYCFMSIYNVKKTFSKYSGCGVIKYFNNLKIEKAKEMINQGYSIDYISTKLGYSRANYFSHTFKKQLGICPSKYKDDV